MSRWLRGSECEMIPHERKIKKAEIEKMENKRLLSFSCRPSLTLEVFPRFFFDFFYFFMERAGRVDETNYFSLCSVFFAKIVGKRLDLDLVLDQIFDPNIYRIFKML